MNKEEISVFYGLTLINEIDELYSELEKETGGWVLKAIEKRFSLGYQIDVDKRVQIMILTHGNGVVGICAKHVDYIAEWAKKRQHKKITWDMFRMQIYAHGIPVL